MESGKTNIEKLADFIMDRRPELLPAYLSVLEVCLNCHKDGLQESKVGIGDVLSGLDDSRTA